MSSRVTMSDIARQAGVSLMTVSRVINKKDNVRFETRQRVEDIIQELDYRPSGIARSLATRQTLTIGLVIPDVTNPFFADITRGVELLAYAQGYHVFLCNTEEDAQREIAVIRSLEEKRVDGLILCSSRLEDQLLVSLLSSLPAAVVINRRLYGSEQEHFDSILLDDNSGGRLAVCHLIQSGHVRIGFLAGPANSYSGKQRQAGYHAAMEQAGYSPEPDWTVHCPPSVEGGNQAALHLIRQHPELTALFCYNDLVAVGALQACAQLNLRVPSDMAVVGHDDIPLAGMVYPSLTTCRVARHELGAQAVTALIERLKDSTSGCKQIVLQPELIIRQSAP